MYDFQEFGGPNDAHMYMYIYPVGLGSGCGINPFTPSG